MKIEQEVINIISRSSVYENVLFLPQEKLERNLYLAVNKCLEAIGGEWNRKQKGHIFDADPSVLLDEMIITGEVTDMKKEFQFFETPKSIVIKMIELLELKDNDIIFEPSAGKGAIADEIKSPFLFLNELYEKNYLTLREKYNENHVTNKDFLTIENESYNKIIMNPPFSNQQDVDHILHAFSLLRLNGILVSIVSESPFFRVNKKSQEFRSFLEDNNATIIDLDRGVFKDSGTMVKARIIKVCKF